MKKLVVVLFIALVSVGVQAKDFGSWRLKANIDKTMGYIYYELEGDALDWHVAIEKQEFLLQIVSFGNSTIIRGLRFLLSSTGNYVGVYDGIIADHGNACDFIDEYPVQGIYEYVLFDAC